MWKIEGFDVFSQESYPLPGEFSTEKEAHEAAEKRLAELEITQPSSMSGGQKNPDCIDEGIQDRVYIIRPDNSSYLYISGMSSRSNES